MARDLAAAMSSSSGESESSSQEEEALPQMQDQLQLDESDGEIDDEMGVRMPFNKAHFKRMLVKTFNNYYTGAYDLTRFNLDEYMRLIEDEQLEAKYGVYLESSNENLLTLKTVPWLDMGELPESYDKYKSEAYQVFVVPKDQFPKKLYFPYNNWQRGFEKIGPLMSYAEMDFASRHGLVENDLEDTIDKATELLRPHRGHVAVIEIWKTVLVIILFLLAFTISIVVGVTYDSLLWSGLVIVIFCVVVLATVWGIKYSYNRHLRNSHFLLAVFCRAENNRHYLNLGLELRPGYLGKWIEISIVDTGAHPDVITYFKDRFLQPAIKLRTKKAESHLMQDEDFVRKQLEIEANIHRKQMNKKKQILKQEKREVQMAAINSDPQEFSCSDVQRGNDNRQSNVSGMQHSQQDMMLSSAVKLASESSFNRLQSNN